MVEKTRHLWRGEDGHLWEIDEFEGPLAGLIIAEVELAAEDEAVVLPAFGAGSHHRNVMVKPFPREARARGSAQRMRAPAEVQRPPG